MAAERADAAPLRPIGLLGGTFDPIHLGHLRLAEEARETLALECVRLIPAGRPPHRGEPGSTADDRLAMAHLATAGNPGLEIDDGEVRARQKSYTVPTLERLRAELGPRRPLVLILGADAFEGLPGWHRWQELFALTHIAIANRPGYAPHARRWPATLSPELAALCQDRHTSDPADLRAAPAGRVIPFDMTPLAISASLIRDLIGHGHSARYLLPDSVLDYIGAHGLYR
ncbi:nicotinate-nucleotide adenylyltransferase [Thauera linaloolentis]|uniref:Probable nicotinate-nucleotide adenylyltransferase n=1 Tax=Thauera linaloolentis (strain DSM 12138 / JCM 21573 / CCUG 41526 / CIP 105981 / IAM 15112 / NBRC 102519 / 47Lol) TaxID=1123367 RepID=N6Z694_THAL4|nr:nicotinate-nucleotide adenylyltransferase [Thauera linaloolentis]ENO89878.1 nicotinate (nicotinamide) nucleotide adenylyltransferase [Thauera linaloolentis 47Lol = DSM 12138]MCM8564575.1 nicotinate-nucleotide adenylyltransferase [Thauera linaloolentis]